MKGRPIGATLAMSLSEETLSRGEPAWLHDVRRDAFEGYRALPAPKWRRTDLASLDVETLASRASRSKPSPRRLAKAEGVTHVPLAVAAREHPELVRGILAAPAPGADKWARLHDATWTEGSLLHVEKGREIEEPLQIETLLAPEGSIVRDVVVLERQAKAHVVARSTGGGPSAFSIDGLDAHVKDGASLSLSTLQDVHHASTLLSYRRALLDRDARLSWVDGLFGAATSVVQNEVRLAGPGSTLRFIGAFFGSERQHMDVTTSALHAGPHSQSQLDMKGALSDEGYSANYSIVNIGPEARNASGHQHQETLLLSQRARADAIPKLDVENNEVSASHGATVGQVDPEQIFYLQSRGFTEARAKRLIVEGFFEPLLREIPVEDVREAVRVAILGRMS